MVYYNGPMAVCQLLTVDFRLVVWYNSFMAEMDWNTWPEVPEDQRPKKLYHNHLMDEEDREHLVSLGWDPRDVRLLPSKSDADKAESLKAWLEGLRMGAIKLSQAVARYVEVEARILGLTSGKTPEKGTEKVGYENMDFAELQASIGGPTGHGEDSKEKFRKKYVGKE